MSSSEPLTVRYEVSVADARAHLIGVEMTIRSDAPFTQPIALSMPIWTPGSYLVREYARHVEALSATSSSAPATSCKAVKTDRCTWVVDATGATEITVKYRVYAHELTVRTNHVDATHAYWNGASTYLIVDGMQRASVAVRVPSGWDVATSLELEPESEAERRPEPEPNVGLTLDAPLDGDSTRVFVAGSIDELIDAPFECGPMRRYGFELYGRQHDIRVWANRHHVAADWAQLERDTQRIVKTEAALIAGEFGAESVIPYRRYTFMWLVSPRGRGGLEHADSCSLLVSPTSFATRAGYLDVLSLVAHEFLHLWNVKRIRPTGLTPYRYDRECYTRLLWWFEGGTSYFDWRVLRLSELCTIPEYATHLAELLARLADTPGALMHSLSDASFDAWIKAYRPDESSVNTTVSYYLKGEIVCALLDIVIRSESDGARSIDDVLRFLWREFGAKDIAVPEDAMASIIERATGVNVDDRLKVWVESSEPLDVASVLALVGLEHVRATSRSARGGLGIRTRTINGRVNVEAVLRGSPAMNAGIEHGDEILAIAGRRVDDGLDAALAQTSSGDEVQVMLSREGMIEMRSVVIGAPSQRAGVLRVRDGATAEQLNVLRGWLGATAASDLAAEPKDREAR